MHGTTMMFLFAVPVMEAMAVYLVPLMLGTRNIAFPRLNAFSYWVYLAGGILLWVAFVLNIGPDAGWFAYVPLAGPEYCAGQARRHLGADDHLHRGRRARGRGRDHRHHPQAARAGHDARRECRCSSGRCWSSSLMVIFSMPAVMLASGMLLIRTGWSAPTSSTAPKAATRCSGSTCSGSSATRRSTSSSCRRPASSPRSSQTFSRRPIFGYSAVVLALVGDRAARLRPVGPPHVRDRPAAARLQLLHRRQHGRSRSRPGSRSSAGSRRSGTAARVSRCRCSG